MTFDPLRSDAPVIVYLDIKSPYAYLATFPAMDLEDRLGTQFDWRPLTLDIPSYLGSAKLDAGGKVAEQNRSPEQWRAVKYAYFDCRRYASLRGLTLRGTVKIWDTSLVHIGFMWAKRQGHDVLRRYIRAAYEPFWKRELDAESQEVVEAVLTAAGAETAGFADFLHGEGRHEHDEMQRAIFDAGIFGVPTFVVDEEIFFGREHLPRVLWHLEGGRGSAPAIAYRQLHSEDKPAEVRDAPALRVVLDLGQPESHLAFHATRRALRGSGLDVTWWPHVARPALAPEGGERTQRHFAFRRAQEARQLELAAEALRVPLPPQQVDTELLHRTWLFVIGYDVARVESFLELALERVAAVGAGLDLDAVRALLEAAGCDAGAFDPEAWRRPAEEVLCKHDEEGVVSTPGYLFGGEFFLGRAHLPLIRWRAGGEVGAPPL